MSESITDSPNLDDIWVLREMVAAQQRELLKLLAQQDDSITLIQQTHSARWLEYDGDGDSQGDWKMTGDVRLDEVCILKPELTSSFTKCCSSLSNVKL